MNSNYYINIQGFMVQNLGLSGNELLVYAVVYGFSQDNASLYYGGYKYLAEALNINKDTARNVLNKLVEKGLVIKIKNELQNGITFNTYKADLSKINPTENYTGGVKNSSGVCENFIEGGGKIHRGGYENFTPYNKYNNKEDINNKNNIYVSENFEKLKIPEIDLENYPLEESRNLSVSSDRESELLEKFEEIWKLYPNKSSKATARQAFLNVCLGKGKHKKLGKANPEEIKQSVIEHCKSKFANREIKYIPYFATFLNARNFEDTIQRENQKPINEIEYENNDKLSYILEAIERQKCYNCGEHKLKVIGRGSDGIKAQCQNCGGISLY